LQLTADVLFLPTQKQRAKDFDEFGQVVAADGKLWKRIEKLDLWREKGQAREQVDEAMKLKSAEYDGKLAQLDASISAVRNWRAFEHASCNILQ
jgi:hypothetical protein